jgi:hypothetical protein
MATIDNVKLLLNIADESSDDILELLISNCEQSINIYCGLTEFNTDLNFIVEELVIQRYSLLGTEGLSEESLGGNKVVFQQNTLDNYSVFLNAYKTDTATSTNSNRFYMR